MYLCLSSLLFVFPSFFYTVFVCLPPLFVVMRAGEERDDGRGWDERGGTDGRRVETNSYKWMAAHVRTNKYGDGSTVLKRNLYSCTKNACAYKTSEYLRYSQDTRGTHKIHTQQPSTQKIGNGNKDNKEITSRTHNTVTGAERE